MAIDRLQFQKEIEQVESLFFKNNTKVGTNVELPTIRGGMAVQVDIRDYKGKRTNGEHFGNNLLINANNYKEVITSSTDLVQVDFLGSLREGEYLNIFIVPLITEMPESELPNSVKDDVILLDPSIVDDEQLATYPEWLYRLGKSEQNYRTRVARYTQRVSFQSHRNNSATGIMRVQDQTDLCINLTMFKFLGIRYRGQNRILLERVIPDIQPREFLDFSAVDFSSADLI